jgi:predicted DNA-binding WGR domain protein
MSAQSYRLHIKRVDPNRNMARYYELSLEPTLFGEISLVRTWGRIGRRGQRRVDLFPTEMLALELFLELLRKKRAKGYKPGRIVPSLGETDIPSAK